MKKTLVAAFAILASLAFSACSKKTEEVQQTVKLRVHYYKQENVDGLGNIFNEFERKNPDIKIELVVNTNEEMERLANEGNLPDIIQVASYARVKEYASRGLVEDLSDTDFITHVLPSSLPAVTWNRKVFAVPMDYAGIGILYNKDIFKRLGIKVPETFSQLEAACKKLKASGIDPFGVLLKENWSMGHFITMMHTALLAQEGKDPTDFITTMNAGLNSYSNVDVKKLQQMLNFYRANMNSDAAQTDGAYQQKLFAEGKCAMMVQGLWAYVDAKKMNPRLNAGFIPFPVFEKAKDNVFFADVDSCFVVSSQSSEANKEAAFKFISWITSAEGQNLWMEQYKLIPPIKGVDVSTFGGPYVDLMSSVERKGSMPWLFNQYPTEVFEGACKNDSQKYMLKQEDFSVMMNKINSQWAAAVSK